MAGKALSKMKDIEQLEQQLVDLQSQMAFQDDAVAALNEAVANQQQEIILLRQQLTLLKQRQDEQSARLDRGDDGEMVSLEDEKPPHY